MTGLPRKTWIYSQTKKPYQRESRTCLDDRTPGPVVGPQLSLSHPILLTPFIGSDRHPLLERCLLGPWLTRLTPSRGLPRRSPKSLRAHPGIIKEPRLTSSLCHYWKVGTVMKSQFGIPHHYFSLQKWELIGITVPRSAATLFRFPYGAIMCLTKDSQCKSSETIHSKVLYSVLARGVS